MLVLLEPVGQNVQSSRNCTPNGVLWCAILHFTDYADRPLFDTPPRIADPVRRESALSLRSSVLEKLFSKVSGLGRSDTPVERSRKADPERSRRNFAYLSPLNVFNTKSPKYPHDFRFPHGTPRSNLSTNLHPPRTSNNLITVHRLNYGIDREL